MASERERGDAIVQRLGHVRLDARATAAARAFKTVHAKYVKSCEAVSECERKRSDALTAIGRADEELDAKVNRLADVLVAAEVTKRGKPFADLSTYSPSAMCGLGYANEVKEATKLVRAVRKQKPPKSVLQQCDAVERAAAAVSAKLIAYDAPKKAWLKAIAARDTELLEWQKALTRLRILAEASLLDQPGAYAALVAEPEAIVVARQARSRRKATTQKTGPIDPSRDGAE